METITPQALAYFRTHRGQLLLRQAADQSNGYWQVQETLRRRFPAEMCRAALSLVELRQEGAAKFSQAGRMFSTAPDWRWPREKSQPRIERHAWVRSGS